jgi:hypothetical protein
MTHHMTSCVDGSECEAMRAARLSYHMTIDVPFAQWACHKVLLTVPLERESPRLISDPVAYPVVRTSVDKDANLALEQRANVIRRTVESVSRCIEC